MSVDEIRARVKKSIMSVVNIDPEDISDFASLKDDLSIDSLSKLEIAVDVQYAFQIEVPEEELSAIVTVDDIVTTVRRYLCVEVA